MGWDTTRKRVKDVDFDTLLPRKHAVQGASSVNKRKGRSCARLRKMSSASALVARILSRDTPARMTLLEAAREVARRTLKEVTPETVVGLVSLGVLLGARRAVMKPDDRPPPYVPGPVYPTERPGGQLVPQPPVLGRRGAPPVVPAGHTYRSTVPAPLQEALLRSMWTD